MEVLRVGAREDIALLRLRGFIDTTTAPEVHRILAQLQKEGLVNILVDMAGVGYVSSAGWGAFVGEIRDLREKGGDLRVAHMSPEVREVFEMLEFDRIIEAYDHIEEAIDDFDLALGLDITAGVMRTAPAEGEASPEVLVPAQPTSSPMAGKAEPLPDELLPIHEKIRRIVIEFPLGGLWYIWKTLRSPRFGRTRINPFRLYRILRELNLETKEKRFRFYRSR
ncbi:MAG: STAS domain-containing protein [candidate division KSB1 bacterium]|nr:STAS domain-containing protein [candidate division KSB1 bacterium]